VNKERGGKAFDSLRLGEGIAFLAVVRWPTDLSVGGAALKAFFQRKSSPPDVLREKGLATLLQVGGLGAGEN